jgi:hypothetical protein
MGYGASTYQQPLRLVGKEKDSGRENIPYLVAGKKKPPKILEGFKSS